MERQCDMRIEKPSDMRMERQCVMRMEKQPADRMSVHRDGKAIYDIILSRSFGGLSHELSALGASGRRICIVTDSTVAGLYLDQVASIFKDVCGSVCAYVFPAGEEQKNLDTVRKLYGHLIDHHLDRRDLMVALGGGVVGDLCGYAAATYLRGISFIQIPTTLLSQVDSSIGGKTGVDFDCYKNMVGAFHMPKLVYTNVSVLSTLDEEQFSSGMGEIIKHGLIRDRGYYQWLLKHREQIMQRDTDTCLEMIRRSDEIKRAVVEADPTEQGERALLNFGHTLGHAIEKCMDFQMFHGHCVGLGMLCAARISANRGRIAEEDVSQLRNLLERFGMPIRLSGLDAQAVLAAAQSDKKMDAGQIRFILLDSVGDAYIDRTVTKEEMLAGLAEISD